MLEQNLPDLVSAPKILMAYHNVFSEKAGKDEPRVEVGATGYNLTTEQYREALGKIEQSIYGEKPPAKPTIKLAQFEEAVEAIRTTQDGHWSPRNLAQRAFAAAGVEIVGDDE